MKIIERIIQYLDYNGFSKYSFYKKTGLSNGFLDKNSNIGSDKCEIISYQYPDLSLEWLITGTGEMLKDKTNPVNIVEEHKKAYKAIGKIGIPLIPLSAMAGFGTGEFQILEHECERYVVPMFKDAEFLIPVRGSSMYPKYSSGDIVACKKIPLESFFQWNKVYVVDTDQGPLIKRINKGSDDNHIQLISENEKYAPFEVHRSHIHALAIVIGVLRLE